MTVPDLVDRAGRMRPLNGEVVVSPRLFRQRLAYTADAPDTAAAVALGRDPAWTRSPVEQVLRRYAEQAVAALSGRGAGDVPPPSPVCCPSVGSRGSISLPTPGGLFLTVPRAGSGSDRKRPFATGGRKRIASVVAAIPTASTRFLA